MERQLIEIEARLPSRHKEDETDDQDTDQLAKMAEAAILPQRIADTTASSRLEGALISFERRPEPWRDGDIVEIFHEPAGRSTLTAAELDGFSVSWTRQDGFRFELELIEDCKYRVLCRGADNLAEK
jgi:hypothetical protein